MEGRTLDSSDPLIARFLESLGVDVSGVTHFAFECGAGKLASLTLTTRARVVREDGLVEFIERIGKYTLTEEADRA